MDKVAWHVNAIIKVTKMATNVHESTLSFALAAYISAPEVNASIPNEEPISVAKLKELKLSTFVIVVL